MVLTSSSDYRLRTREQIENIEQTMLAPYACQSVGAHATRRYAEPEHAYRTCFQRDRDRIIHSRAFRRLKHKRQVFLISESDHYRTRLTHTLEVAQLSRTMARALGLNEDLVEAIALGHDVGHTPFGHLGETVLDQVMRGQRPIGGTGQEADLGGFKHNYQSLRVVDLLEKKYVFPGLNLSAQVREGLIKHTRILRGRFKFPDFNYDGLRFDSDMASTLEGQVVAICDEIAQRTHDLEDGVRAGLVEWKQVAELEIVRMVARNLPPQTPGNEDDVKVAMVVRALINYLVDDVIGETLKNIAGFERKKKRLKDFDEELVRFSNTVQPLQKQLNKFIYREIIDFSRVRWSDELGEKLLFRMFEAYCLHPELLPERVVLGAGLKGKTIDSITLPAQRKEYEVFFRHVCDYIAGMTDNYALREAQKLANRGKLAIDDLNVGLALGDIPK